MALTKVENRSLPPMSNFELNPKDSQSSQRVSRYQDVFPRLREFEKKVSIWEDPRIPIQLTPDHLLLESDVVQIYAVDPSADDPLWNQVGPEVIDKSFVFDVYFPPNVQLTRPDPRPVYLNPKRQLPLHLIKFNPEQLANRFRSILTSDIESYAIETVQIWINDSFYYDEILAHRLGLIPIIELPSPNQESPLVETPDDQIAYAIDVEAGSKPYRVMSSDLQSSDPTKILFPNLTVVLLLPGQRLKLLAKAEKGTGQKHAKWSSTVLPVDRPTSDPNVFRFKMGLTGAISALNVLEQAVRLYSQQLKLRS